MAQSAFQTWFLAARPKTLPAAVAPVVIGTVMAYGDLAFSLWPALAALWGAVWIQIGTNLANDYFDFKSGADSGPRLGPVRATQAGWVSPGAMRNATAIAFGLAFLAGIYLVWVGGWPIVAIGLASILFGVLYTGGPFPLGYHGLGEIFVFLFFGLVAVGGTYYVQALTVTPAVLVAGVAPGLMSVAILAVNNLRDWRSDRDAGKRTLAARWGPSFGRWEYVLGLAGTAATPVVLVVCLGGSPYALLALLFALPAVQPLRIVLGGEEGTILNEVLAATGKLLLLFSALFSVGWLL